MSKVFYINLGCAKNLVDSEYILGVIKKQGYAIVNDPLDADIAIVNTCAFIRPAVEESIDTILELVNLKDKGNLTSLFVVGVLCRDTDESCSKKYQRLMAGLVQDKFTE